MGYAIRYSFEECQCLDTRGLMQNIPAGIHQVAERDAVTVWIENRTLDLNKNAFNQLKADGKAHKV